MRPAWRCGKALPWWLRALLRLLCAERGREGRPLRSPPTLRVSTEVSVFSELCNVTLFRLQNTSVTPKKPRPANTRPPAPSPFPNPSLLPAVQVCLSRAVRVSDVAPRVLDRAVCLPKRLSRQTVQAVACVHAPLPSSSNGTACKVPHARTAGPFRTGTG